MENKNILGSNIIYKALYSLKDVMAITGRGKDFSRTLMDDIINNNKKFYDKFFKIYRYKYIKSKHFFEALGYSDDEYYHLFRKSPK